MGEHEFGQKEMLGVEGNASRSRAKLPLAAFYLVSGC